MGKSKKKRSIIRFTVLFAIVCAIGYTIYANAASEQGAVKVGEPATNFALVDLEQERFELGQNKGKGVFINFWGTFCEPCEREMPYIENAYEEYKDEVEMIAVNVDEAPLTVQSFINRHGLTFPVAIDERREVTRAYGIGPLPATILVDEHGIVQKVHTGAMTEEMVHEFFQSIVPDA
ncbi:thiol-disulfide oxidoreductase ResA [Shouchella clausii]|uniref:thiol-disulfide oxidoreductase ResA n=1 Tax=Shouchella clausii TaxID=79880 RepID=UPI000BA5B728|nr:thiol-disulfide oxidoreductase ResA [Shouchella clausii]PAE93551.1 thiol-disulfide oxidoreductase [Shouchella clausii]